MATLDTTPQLTRSSPTRSGRSAGPATAADLPWRDVVLLVGLILGFIFWNGIQVFIRAGYGLGIITSTEWAPTAIRRSSACCRSSPAR
jgi:hypothetical protein